MIIKLLKNHPKDAYLNYALADEFYKQGFKEKAIDTLRNNIENCPYFLKSYYKLGTIFEQDKNIQKAIFYYKKGKSLALKSNEKIELYKFSEALLILNANDGEYFNYNT